MTAHKYGKGTGFYLACRIDTDFLKKFYSEVSVELDLLPRLPIKKNTTKISIQVRENKIAKYLFVQNFSHEKQAVILRKKMKEKLSGKIEENEVIIEPYGTKIYQI